MSVLTNGYGATRSKSLAAVSALLSGPPVSPLCAYAYFILHPVLVAPVTRLRVLDTGTSTDSTGYAPTRT
eukprot:1064085-Rhodomonas_salina.6